MWARQVDLHDWRCKERNVPCGLIVTPCLWSLHIRKNWERAVVDRGNQIWGNRFWDKGKFFPSELRIQSGSILIVFFVLFI